MPTTSESATSDTLAGQLDDGLPDDQWVATHYERIHKAAWSMTGDRWAAEDLAQETFVVAFDQWDRFGGRASRATWLYGILLRLNRRRWRSIARMKRRLEKYIHRNQPADVHDPIDELATQQWRESVWSDVAKLPTAQRDAIVLRFSQDMSYQEIADATRCAVGTAKTRVHHGLKKLRDIRGESESLSTTGQELKLSASK